jgi:prophage tail gpP-like protein
MSLKIQINNQNIPCEQISINKSIESLADSFSATTPLNPAEITTGVVKITLGEVLIFTGWIDQISQNITGDNNQTKISGRSKSTDIIDSRITATIHNKTLFEIAKEIFAKFNQNITTTETTTVVDKFAITCESAFEALSQLTKQQNLIMIEQPSGDVVLTTKAKINKTYLKLNHSNLETLNISQNLASQFHKYEVKNSPNTSSLQPGSSAFISTATDPQVRATRVVETIADKLTTPDACKQRANELKSNAANKSITATATSMGFGTNNEIWQVNSVYSVAGVNMTLVSATFNQTGNNQTTSLNFEKHNG